MREPVRFSDARSYQDRRAKFLLNAGFPEGAYYLAGYSVECALKACIAKATQRFEFPDKKRADSSYTHDLTELARIANLKKALTSEAEQNAAFRNNWDLVKQWSEQSRYRRYDGQSARALVDAVEMRRHGVIAWIKRHW